MGAATLRDGRGVTWELGELLIVLVQPAPDFACWMWCSDTYDSLGRLVSHRSACSHCDHISGAGL
jgi:hypothetical protein